jgi:hypothetical protein
MSNQLTLLKENYCRPATLLEKADKGLFPLERHTPQARTLSGKAPCKRLGYLEFDPAGLKQSYRDAHSGAELPVFAVFNLEGSNELHAYIGAKRKSSFDATLNLANHLPFGKTQQLLQATNAQNLRAHRLASLAYLALALLAAGLMGLVAGPRLLNDPAFGASERLPEALVQLVLLCGVTFCATLLSGFLLSTALVNRLFPAKTLSLTASFDGLLPAATREKALRARDFFDNLYLVVDQQNRWQSKLLPIPESVLLDPLLIGEKRKNFQSRYYLIDQFELTKAEDYLVAEFLQEPD